MNGLYSVYSSNRTIMRNTIIQSYTKLPPYFARIQPCLEGYWKKKSGIDLLYRRYAIMELKRDVKIV